MRRLDVAALTDVGRQRDHNEDAEGFDEEAGLYVVCDGMGGHASGEVASRLTLEYMTAFVRDHRDASPEELPHPVPSPMPAGSALLVNAIKHANERVYVEAMKDPSLEGMGTTLVAVLAGPDELHVAHVGDSRVYRLDPEGELEQVTRDHSLLNQKIDEGELVTDEEIEGFEQGNVIVQAVGLKDWVEPEVQEVPRRPGDRFLLCTDGLTDLVGDDAIRETVLGAEGDLARAVEQLVDRANEEGGKDNVTAMLVEVSDRVEAEPDAEAAGVGFHEEDTDPAGTPALDDDDPTPPRGTAAVDAADGAEAADAADAAAEPSEEG